jgi:hypothetical protein
MIPGTFIRDAIGYCDGTKDWWARYFDLITRARVSLFDVPYDGDAVWKPRPVTITGTNTRQDMPLDTEVCYDDRLEYPFCDGSCGGAYSGWVGP